MVISDHYAASLFFNDRIHKPAACGTIRDIMRQSPAYDIIKEEELQQEIQKLIFEILKIRFEIIPVRIMRTINNITKIETLEMLHSNAVKCSSVEEFEEKMKLILEE